VKEISTQTKFHFKYDSYKMIIDHNVIINIHSKDTKYLYVSLFKMSHKGRNIKPKN